MCEFTAIIWLLRQKFFLYLSDKLSGSFVRNNRQLSVCSFFFRDSEFWKKKLKVLNFYLSHRYHCDSLKHCLKVKISDCKFFSFFNFGSYFYVVSIKYGLAKSESSPLSVWNLHSTPCNVRLVACLSMWKSLDLDVCMFFLQNLVNNDLLPIIVAKVSMLWAYIVPSCVVLQYAHMI